MYQIVVEKCIHCGLCTIVCPVDAIDSPLIDFEHCIECGECVTNCPESAIRLLD